MGGPQDASLAWLAARQPSRRPFHRIHTSPRGAAVPRAPSRACRARAHCPHAATPRRRSMSQASSSAVSVISATYNRGAKLRVTLEALVEQETPPGLGWEVLVVDNGSTDSTLEVFRTVAMQVPGRFRYVFEPTVGKSRAINAGLKVARGDVIALTDDDVTPARNWVATAATVLDTRQVDGAGGPILPQWEIEPPAWVHGNRRLLDTLGIMDFDKPAMLPLPRGIHYPQIWGG